eukprot:1158353-Pelagomonas_calceolata.AAC.3
MNSTSVKQLTKPACCRAASPASHPRASTGSKAPVAAVQGVCRGLRVWRLRGTAQTTLLFPWPPHDARSLHDGAY